MAYISRIRLRRDSPTSAIAALLVPTRDGDRSSAMHRVMWSIHTDGPDRQRDFLWREDEGAQGEKSYISVSARPPVDVHTLFDVETKAYEPELRKGDRLTFALRVNATTSIPLPDQARGRGRRVDVVMAALHATKATEGAYGPRRDAVALTAATAWMTRQGETHGFRSRRDSDDAPRLAVDAYRVVELPRERGAGRLRLGVLDLSGDIVVTSPDRFVAMLSSGLGHARAFGLGLMLVRRSRA